MKSAGVLPAPGPAADAEARSFPAPPGTSGWLSPHGGYVSVTAIARSGRLLAANAVVPPLSHGRVRVFVLNVSGGVRAPVAVPSSTAFLWAPTAWSVSGSWLFYQGPGARMWAYQPGTRRVRSSAIPCCSQYTVMATISSGAR